MGSFQKILKKFAGERDRLRAKAKRTFDIEEGRKLALAEEALREMELVAMRLFVKGR